MALPKRFDWILRPKRRFDLRKNGRLETGSSVCYEQVVGDLLARTRIGGIVNITGPCKLQWSFSVSLRSLRLCVLNVSLTITLRKDFPASQYELG